MMALMAPMSKMGEGHGGQLPNQGHGGQQNLGGEGSCLTRGMRGDITRGGGQGDTVGIRVMVLGIITTLIFFN